VSPESTSGTARDLPAGALAMACRTADAAAEQAGVRIAAVTDPAGISAVAGFLAEVWQSPPTNPPLPAEVLRSLCHAGGGVLGAYADDHLVGAAAAVFSPPGEHAVYSLVAAAAMADRGVGFALKQAQRVWALRHGATVMCWTFDPLVGRNARFNLVKLGAVGAEYLVDFYGPMDDGINGGDESDRLTARWDLRAGGTAGTEQTGPTEATVTRRAPDGLPLACRAGDVLWCRVPPDVLQLRRDDPATALSWRHAVRAVFTEAFARGYVATGMTREGWYRLTRTEQG
jgi:predicted GNAT superfamily acetyltransferase